MSASETTTGFRALGDASGLPEDYVKAYYLEDLKRRVSWRGSTASSTPSTTSAPTKDAHSRRAC